MYGLALSIPVVLPYIKSSAYSLASRCLDGLSMGEIGSGPKVGPCFVIQELNVTPLTTPLCILLLHLNDTYLPGITMGLYPDKPSVS